MSVDPATGKNITVKGWGDWAMRATWGGEADQIPDPKNMSNISELSCL